MWKNRLPSLEKRFTMIKIGFSKYVSMNINLFFSLFVSFEDERKLAYLLWIYKQCTIEKFRLVHTYFRQLIWEPTFEWKARSTKSQINSLEQNCTRPMPCPLTSPKMFCDVPHFLCQTKNVFTYCVGHRNFVPVKKMICIQKNWFLCRHKSFWRGTKCRQIFGLAQKIWTGTKHFGTCKRTRH